jgi:hypothetical protein
LQYQHLALFKGMTVPFGFGLGDFLGGIQTIAQIGKALKDSGGSSEKFIELIKTLHAFETVLRWIAKRAEDRRNANSSSTNPDYADDEGLGDLQRLIAEGRKNIDDILDKVDKYHARLGSTSKWQKRPE